MFTCKKGDKVRAINSFAGEFTRGKEYIVRSVDKGGIGVELDDKGSTTNGWGKDNFELVEPAVEPTTLSIQAGRYYKTRDGRKVGPATENRESREYPWEVNGLTFDNDGFWITGDKHSDDLIAEWVDEPTATAEATTPKFKVGDRVYTIDDENDFGTITRAEKGKFAIQWDARPEGSQELLWNDYEMVHVVAPAPTTPAIVALIQNGTPAPSTTPKVHASQEAATVEAGRLADLHKGQKFGVFVLADTKEVPKPVYDHEWQRLAAEGRFIAAVKELGASASLDLLSAKQGVERFIEKIAA